MKKVYNNRVEKASIITPLFFMNSKQILDNLSGHLKNALARAIGFATSLNHPQVKPLHLLLSILQEKGSLGSEILNKLKFDERTLIQILEQQTPRISELGVQTATLAELGPLSKKALEKAMLLAYEYEQNYVGTEHLLYGILHTHDKELEKIYTKMNLDEQELEDQIINILESGSKFPDIEDISAMMEEMGDIAIDQAPAQPPVPAVEKAPQAEQTKAKNQKPSMLDLFCTDLTALKEQRNIDPVIGREQEIERLINILCRRTKNNPVLIGEPGVGKTAIVEGLAKRISEGKVPDILKRKRILSLDLTLLISGTIYRGEFESRLRQIIEEINKQPNAILFIDEIHNIIGAGSNQGTMDAANILKPALARGRLRCIGATTLDEYKKYISNDPALERRFQSVQVEEPNRDDTVRILTGIAPLYEDYHEVHVSPEILSQIVDLSIKYIHDNFLPDKAIDILDEAAASVRVSTASHPLTSELHSLEKTLTETREKKQEYILGEKFEEAKKLKTKEEKLLKEIQTLEKKIKKIRPAKRKNVTSEDIAKVLASKLHTNKNIFLEDEYTQLKNLGTELKENIIGQDKAIDTIVETLQRASLGLKGNNHPLASFLFVGPTGVGKTELAKILARELYHDEKALIKMDMSEFAEQHGISKILGSPAGYIGYKERNHFTESLRKRPYSVVLFDEIDKAHPDVMKLLLQILDEGELTESNGKKVVFRHAVVILTSNIGAEFFKQKSIGFGSAEIGPLNKQKELSIMTALKESFGSPLLGRLDATCLFTPLEKNNLETIVQKRIAKISSLLEQKLDIIPETSALNEIVKNLEQELGARPIEATLERILYPVLFAAQKEIQKKKKVKLIYEKNKFLLA